MKRTNHYKREKKFIQKFLVSNWELLVFVFLLVLGALWGCAIVKDSVTSVNVSFEDILLDFIEIRSNQTFFQTFLHLFLPAFLFVVIVFLFGLSPVGIPVFFLIPIFRGLGLGFVTGYLYSLYGMKGLTYCLLMIYPGAILSVVALIFCCVEGFKMSQCVLMCFTDKPLQLGLRSDVKVYTVKFLIFSIITIVSCIAGAVLNQFFSSLFVF